MNRSTTFLLAAAIIALILLTYTCTPWASESDGPVATDASAQQTAPESAPSPESSTEAVAQPAPAPQPASRPARTPASPSPSANAPAKAPAAVETDGPYAVAPIAPMRVLGPTNAPSLVAPIAVDNTRTESQYDAMGRLVTLRGRYRIDLPSSLTLARRTRGFPGSTINTPTGFGPGWGQFYGGLSFQERIRYADARDGVMTVGFGLGNPYRTVGMDVSVNLLDTYTEFGKDRSLTLRLHRRLPARSSIAVGWENVWHTAGTDGGSSRYVVASKFFGLREDPESPFGSVVVSLGAGDERFLSERRFALGEKGVNPFGAVAVRVLPQASAIANWTGQDLSLGVSVAPIRRWPLVITPALMDVTGNAGDGTRFSISAGLGYNFRY